MYRYFVLGVTLALASLGSARPAEQTASKSLNLNTPFRGFPAESLPLNLTMSDVGNNSSANLTLPLYPGWHYDIEQIIVLTTGVPPDGSQLIANMAAFLYHIWIDTANRPVSKPITAHEPPFTNFRWTVVPNTVQGAVLTPLKVGIVTCWAMRDAIEHPTWPGHIQARIFDADEHSRFALEVGAVDVANFGRRDESSSSSSASNGSIKEALSPRTPLLPRRSTTIPLPTTDAARTNASEAAAPPPLSRLPFTVAQRWLRCFSRLYWAVLSHYSLDTVGDDPTFPIDYHTHLPCNAHPPEQRDRVDLYFDPAARPGSPYELSWDLLALSMLEWIHGIIFGKYDYLMPFEITEGPQLVAVLRIVTVPDPPMDDDDAGATTTA